MNNNYVDGRTLRNDDGEVLGTFSCHWAAVAAMIRQHTPDFVSTGGDRPEDLEVERTIKRNARSTPPSVQQQRSAAIDMAVSGIAAQINL